MDETLTPNGHSVPTVFGATLFALMTRRGITRWAALSKKLAEHGYRYSAARIGNWAYGRNAVNGDFPVAFAQALDLSDEEKRDLAWAFTFGQRKRVDTPA